MKGRSALTSCWTKIQTQSQVKPESVLGVDIVTDYFITKDWGNSGARAVSRSCVERVCVFQKIARRLRLQDMQGAAALWRSSPYLDLSSIWLQDPWFASHRAWNRFMMYTCEPPCIPGFHIGIWRVQTKRNTFKALKSAHALLRPVLRLY